VTDPRPAESPRTELDESEQRLLAFERAWADRVGNREAAIRAEFGVSSARYYQMLYALIDSPIAVRHDPLLVRRLQRLRDSRRRARARPFTSLRIFPSDSQDITE
jgi:IS4 transposase